MANPLHPCAMKTLLIVYHSMTGGTRQMVEAAARGAVSEPTSRVRLLPAPEAQAIDLLDADGYIFGTPENLAAIAGLMKDFFDRTYYPALDRISGRPYATLICAGSRQRSSPNGSAFLWFRRRIRVPVRPGPEINFAVQTAG